MRPARTSRFAAIAAGDVLPGRSYTPSIAELMLYGAVIWNPHRIHYDLAFTTEELGYPGLPITGPLQGDWLLQVVTEWMGPDGALERYSFSHRQSAYLGETLRTGGRVLALDAAGGRVTLALEVRNAAGDVITPGEAVVRFPPGQ